MRRLLFSAVCGLWAFAGSATESDGTFRDRFWMWGHHAHAFRTTGESKVFGPDHIDIGEACREMGVPNVCVCRWQALPKPPFEPYMETLSHLKRIGWSVADSDKDYTFAQKKDMMIALSRKYPSIRAFWLDDWFQSWRQPDKELWALRKELETLPNRPLLTVVFYSHEWDFNPKPTFEACDQISFWVWNAEDIPEMEARFKKCRALAGPGKPILLGIYMWNFEKQKEIPRELMQKQLALAEKLMRSGEVAGLIFHCTPLVDTKLEAVAMCKAWIAQHGDDRWGAACEHGR